MSQPPVPPSSGALCWNCQQPLQSGSINCLWCGVAQQAAPAQLVVAPIPVGVGAGAAGVDAIGLSAAGAGLIGAPPQGAPQAGSVQPGFSRGAATAAAPRAPRGTASLGPAFAGTAAGTAARLGAFTVDVIAVLLIAGAVTIATASFVYGILALAEIVVGLWVLEARTGLTFGNALFRLRAARDDAPYTPGVGRSFVRWFITGAGFIAAAIGAWIVIASSAWDTSGRGRSWADRAARTVVVSVPPRSVRRAGVAHQPGALLPGMPAQTMPPIHPLSAQAEPVEPEPALPAPTQAVQAQPAPTQPAPVHEAPVVLAAPQVISTSGRHAIVDEDSASASATGVGGQAFRDSPVPLIESPARTLSAGIVPTNGADVASPDGTLLLIFDTGQREQLASPVSVNLGRNPVATEPGDKLIIVNDPESSVSKTHLRLEHSRGRTWLIDGSSTNGTELLSDDGDITALVPGERILLDDGVRVRIGNRTFTVSLLLGSEKAS